MYSAKASHKWICGCSAIIFAYLLVSLFFSMHPTFVSVKDFANGIIPNDCACRHENVVYDLCYSLPTNASIRGRRFDCKYITQLQNLGLLSNQSTIDLQYHYTPAPRFVTAMSENHYREGLTLKTIQLITKRTLTFLLTGCILLSLLPSELEIMKPVRIDYDHEKAEDAAWNMTLMRQLNVAESPRGTHMWHKECKYSKRFLERKDGNGTLDMLVAGNSYACNQGDLVYNAFKPYARHFNIFCVPDCEMFLPHCKIIKFNFTQIVEQLQPAVVFLVERSLSLKVPLNVIQPIENDKTFRLYLKTIEFLEKVTKKNGLVIEDAFFARHRIRELNKRCKKCELVDYMPVLVDKKGQYLAYNPDTNLMYLDHEQHFNRFGRQRLQIVFDNLAKDFGATWKSNETPLSASTLPVN